MTATSYAPFSLTAKALVCQRHTQRLLQGVSLSVGNGDLMQVVGPNGVGKTTLLRVLAGLLPHDEGQLCWQGEPLSHQRLAFNQQLLFLGHLSGVKYELTALENLDWLMQLEGGRDESSLVVALQRVGLAGYEDHPCQQLSAGQQRRVALARLLLTERPLWILDEPLTAIDQAGVQALEQLFQLHAARGGAVVLTSHHALQSLTSLQQVEIMPPEDVADA